MELVSVPATGPNFGFGYLEHANGGHYQPFLSDSPFIFSENDPTTIQLQLYSHQIVDPRLDPSIMSTGISPFAIPQYTSPSQPSPPIVPSQSFDSPIPSTSIQIHPFLRSNVKAEKEEYKTPRNRKVLTDEQRQDIYIYHLSHPRPWPQYRTARKFGVERRYTSTHIPSNTYLQDI